MKTGRPSIIGSPASSPTAAGSASTSGTPSCVVATPSCALVGREPSAPASTAAIAPPLPECRRSATGGGPRLLCTAPGGGRSSQFEPQGGKEPGQARPA